MRMIVYQGWYWGLFVGNHHIQQGYSVHTERLLGAAQAANLLEIPVTTFRFGGVVGPAVGLKEVDIRERPLPTMLKA